MSNFEINDVLSSTLDCYVALWSIVVVAALAFLVLDELFFGDHALLWKLPRLGELQIPQFSIRSLLLHTAIAAVSIKLIMHRESVVAWCEKAARWVDQCLAPLATPYHLHALQGIAVMAIVIAVALILLCFARWCCDSTSAARLILHGRSSKARRAYSKPSPP